MTYYLVPLYNAKAEEGKRGARLELVDRILVEKDIYTIGGCREKMTDSYFNCYSPLCFDENGLREEFSSSYKYSECGGHQLLVKSEDMENKENIATEEEISAYIDHYEDSNWKKVYDEIVYTIGSAYMKSTTK